MALLLDIEQNLPEEFIYDISSGFKIPVHRAGNFYGASTGPGCGKQCLWNGGGYYMDEFICGTTYPSGKTFYCSSDCYKQVGHTARVFLSYRWNDPHIADDITELALGTDIKVIRDIREIGFMDAISEFMETAGSSRYFIALMTKEYFYSRYCLFELSVLSKSKEIVRTIPVILNNAGTTEAESDYCAYWENKYGALLNATRQLGTTYSHYLQKELDLIQQFPKVIHELLHSVRSKSLPDGNYWLKHNCRYLLGAIKTTFQPTEDDASNWTFSNRKIRGNRYDDGKKGKRWDAVPCYLHASTPAEAYSILRFKNTHDLILQLFYENESDKSMPPGTHLLLMTRNNLLSAQFCQRLLMLTRRQDVTLIPLFTDVTLRAPGSEVTLLLHWLQVMQQPWNDPASSSDIHQLLPELGPVIAQFRDQLVPDIFSTLNGTSQNST